MNGTVISSILFGSRIQPVSEGYVLELSRAAEKVPQSVFEPHESIRPALKIGEKRVNYNPYLPVVNIGILASPISIIGDVRYSTIQVMGLGTREGYDGENTHFSVIEMSQEVNKIYTGISTHGIGYTPVVADNKDKSELRRWPRNWYGDNIKN